MIDKSGALRDPNTFRYIYLAKYFEAHYRHYHGRDAPELESRQTELERLGALVGSELRPGTLEYKAYELEVLRSLRRGPEPDVDSVLHRRPAVEIAGRNALFTCIDFTKVVGWRAINAGMPADQLRVSWLMDEEGYQRMRSTGGPRPLVHTGFLLKGNRAAGDAPGWYFLNVEAEDDRVVRLPGGPKRLEGIVTLNQPRLVAGRPLVPAYLGPIHELVSWGISGEQIANITASGHPRSRRACKGR